MFLLALSIKIRLSRKATFVLVTIEVTSDAQNHIDSAGF